jgi:asparagine synthetase A
MESGGMGWQFRDAVTSPQYAGYRTLDTARYVEGHYVRGYEPILDETHSLYVLQFDWEITIKEEDRNLPVLQETVRKIY